MKICDFITFPGSVGVTTTGSNVAPAVVERIKSNGWKNLNVLDICCGVGTLGLLTMGNLPKDTIMSLTLSDTDSINMSAAKATVNKMGFNNVTIIQSDGMENIQKNEDFDLILSHPPHFWGVPNEDRHNKDIYWHFHLPFFKNLHKYLKIGGEAWLIEANGSGIESVAKDVINENKINFVSYTSEPRDPSFYWMILKREF